MKIIVLALAIGMSGCCFERPRIVMPEAKEAKAPDDHLSWTCMDCLYGIGHQQISEGSPRTKCPNCGGSKWDVCHWVYSNGQYRPTEWKPPKRERGW